MARIHSETDCEAPMLSHYCDVTEFEKHYDFFAIQLMQLFVIPDWRCLFIKLRRKRK
jgi:hypothetical protein